MPVLLIPCPGSPQGQNITLCSIPIASHLIQSQSLFTEWKNGLLPPVCNPKVCQDGTNLNLSTKNRLHVSRCSLENFWHSTRSEREGKKSAILRPFQETPIKTVAWLPPRLRVDACKTAGRRGNPGDPGVELISRVFFSCHTFSHLGYLEENSFKSPS